MRCHIIVSLESIECVESHRWPNKNAGAKLREYGARQKDRPIAATSNCSTSTCFAARAGAVLQALEAGGIECAAVTVARPSLEDVYLRYAGRTFSEAEAQTETEKKEDNR